MKALTYKIKKPPRPGISFGMYDIIKNYKILPNNILSIPAGRLDLVPEDYELIDKRILVPGTFPDPKLQLREAQQPVYDAVTGSCFINAKVGWGKTFAALHIARKLGQKTLIVCHNTMLRDQWIEEVEKLFNCYVGIIGSGHMDTDHSIVVGNIQTLTKVLPQISKDFGTVIVDEAHHCPASTFTSFIDGMHAKYRIGLSGTMARKDGRNVLFKDFFGPVLLQPPASDTMTPTVLIIKPGIALAPGEPWARKINILLYDPEYQQLIAKIAQIQIDKGHKVLVIADRVEFLQNVGELIGESCVCITGEVSFEDRMRALAQIRSGEKNCVVGTRSIFSEGISENRLSCVVLASPISSAGLLEQIVGRIQREHEDKITPLVVDIQFSGPADRKQNNDRLAFYMREGWDVRTL